MKRLIAIQQNLRSRKDKSDDKGRYKYRSAEDILEAVKPILAEQKCAVILTDSIWESAHGEFFLRATATLIAEAEFTTKDDTGKEATYRDSKEIAHADGFAKMDDHITKRYDEKSKTWYEVRGMSNEQCTGCASSYARKYALCGLFAIDDSDQDPDGITQESTTDKAPTKQSVKPKEATLATKIAAAKNADDINALMAVVKVASSSDKQAFKNKVAELLLVFDKSQGKYINSK